MSWIVEGVLAAIGALLFVAPHRGKPVPFAKRTLAGSLRESLRSDRFDSPRALVIGLLVVLGCLSVFLPAVCLAVARLVPEDAARLVLLGEGLLLVLATLAAVLVLVVSHSSFGFGGGWTRDATPFAWLIPAYVGGSALCALVGAAWPAAARWLLGSAA